MLVQNKLFYHIHRIETPSDRWEPGSKITWFNRELNFFNKFWETQSYYSERGDGDPQIDFLWGLRDYLKKLKGCRKKQHEDMLKKSENIIRSYCMFIREIIFEEVRNQFFPGLPSRRTCIWVIERPGIEGWWESFKGEKQLLTLNLTGNLHKGNNKFLKIGTFAHNIYRENAFQYWTGSDGSDPEDEECIFEGLIEIVKEQSDPTAL